MHAPLWWEHWKAHWEHWSDYRTVLGHRFAMWAIRHLPAGVVARPMEWFVAILCLLSGTAMIAGVSEPAAAERQLSQFTFHTWALTLIVGGLAMGSGLSSIKWTTFPSYVLTRVPEYRFGLRLLWIGCFVWSIVLLANSGLNAMLSAGFALVFSFLCGVRLLTVGRNI
jgi:hypothetical protein